MHHLGGFFAKPRPMLAGDFVTTDSGTGLVHMSPDHGEDDFDLCKANGIDPVFAVEGRRPIASPDSAPLAHGCAIRLDRLCQQSCRGRGTSQVLIQTST
jgi:hypothetical protein